MSFTSKNLQSVKRRGMTFFKGATLFFLGMSVVLFTTKAFIIEPITRNVSQVIQKILFTNNGDVSGATGVYIDGSGGNAYFAGTVSAQQICLSGDCKTNRPAESQSLWSTGSSGRIYYNSGNVGIGTTTPLGKLHVEGESTLNGDVDIKNSSSIRNNYNTGTRLYSYFRKGLGTITQNYWEFLFSNNNYSNVSLLKINMPDSGGKVIVNNSQKDIDFIVYPEGSSMPTIFAEGSNGNVGIGTDTPQAKLHVDGNVIMNGNIYGTSLLGDTFLNIIGGNNSNLNKISLFVNNIENFRIKGGYVTINPNGGTGVRFNVIGNTPSEYLISTDPTTNNVGIGTTTPSEKLHVEGNGKFTQAVQVGDPGTDRCTNASDVGKIGYRQVDVGFDTHKAQFVGCIKSGGIIQEIVIIEGTQRTGKPD